MPSNGILPLHGCHSCNVSADFQSYLNGGDLRNLFSLHGFKDQIDDYLEIIIDDSKTKPWVAKVDGSVSMVKRHKLASTLKTWNEYSEAMFRPYSAFITQTSGFRVVSKNDMSTDVNVNIVVISPFSV